jgi:hypothetical protein
MPPRGGWRTEHAEFAQWLCQPSDDEMGGKGRGLRKPATFTGYSAEHGIPLRTLYDWMDFQDWPDLMAECAKESFLNLDPEFFKNWAVSLLKPEPNDRLVAAWIRYGRPALLKEKENGRWGILASLNARSQKSERVHAHSVRLIRELPLEQREMFLDILDNAERMAEVEAGLDEPARKSVKVTRLGEKEPEPTATLPALPAPAQDAATPRYDPQRGIRKPLRKPKLRT